MRAEQRVQGGCGVPGGEKLPDRVRSEAWGCGQTQVVEQFLGTVLCGPQLEKLRVLIDELGIHGARQELLVVEHILQEGDVGLWSRSGQESACSGTQGKEKGRGRGAGIAAWWVSLRPHL